MMSPEILSETKDKNLLAAELGSLYDNMIKAKIEIIKNKIVIYPSQANEKIYSIGLGFAVTQNN